MKFRRAFLLEAGIAAGFPAPAATLLNTLLIPGATLSVGELTFSRFDYQTTGADIPAANLVPRVVSESYPRDVVVSGLKFAPKQERR